MTRWWSLARANPSGVQLLAQLGAILAYPYFGDTTTGRMVIGVVGMVIVLLSVWTVRASPALTWVALLLGGPALLLTVWEAFDPTNRAVVVASAAFHTPFYLYVSYAMIRYLFADRKVTPDDILATGAAFTVVAWAFGYIFSGVQAVWPGSFAGTSAGDVRSWFELLFASFANLTGVGLSDVVPVRPHARSVVMIEQVTGVFYVAFVISRLVALAVTTGARHDSDA
jgi:Ion channel